MIQVGQVLDKYELLERVGQGGMAVVYRGIDRQLKRTVAIKILHKHLSDYQEARDRFEREAQAVAKLRHENILEIFDYAAKESESYIVTEFIDGQTLKQFITDRPIQYPEIGAMIVLQVARALAHAHAGGILHRDIKPENIMIRSDGVVKLMDFGISHMVDLERLTVTGQLLGSPAYMAPEHVEGRPLDFRTDVFAVGIVLYQLTVGKLPFEGKNPHEVLKRIAECKFVDPRQANPRIGNRLGKIILRAMAAMPNDRFPAITEMVLALEAYLTESGLQPDKIPGELGRYFKSPAAYELALRERLLDTLSRRGQELLDEDNRAGALDVFDRVLTIDPENAKVLAILDRLNRRARLKHVGIGVAAVLAIGGGALAIAQKNKPEPPVPSHEPALPLPIEPVGPTTQTSNLPPLPPEQEIDAGVDDVAAVIDGGEPQHVVIAPHIDAAVSEAKHVHITAFPNDATISVDGQPAVPVGGGFDLPISKPVHVRVHSELAFDEERDLDGSVAAVDFRLSYRPANIVPKCGSSATVMIDGKDVTLDQQAPVFFSGITTERPIEIEFVINDPPDVKRGRIRISPGQTKIVKCEELGAK